MLHTHSYCPVYKLPAARGSEWETSVPEILIVGLGFSCNEHGEELFLIEGEAQGHLLVALYPFDLGGQVLESGVH